MTCKLSSRYLFLLVNKEVFLTVNFHEVADDCNTVFSSFPNTGLLSCTYLQNKVQFINSTFDDVGPGVNPNE